MKYLGTLVLIMLVLTGCGRKPKQVEMSDPAAILRQKVEDVLKSVMEQDLVGNTNGVISLMEDAIGNPELAGARSDLLRQLIDFEMYAGLTEKAETRMLSEVSRHPIPVVSSAMRLADFYLESDRVEDAEAWIEKMMAIELPDETARSVHDKYTRVLIRQARQEQLFAHLVEMVNRFDAQSAPTLRVVRDHYVGKRDLETADSMFVSLGSQTGGRAWLLTFVDSGRLDLMGRRREWAAAEELFKDMAARLDDGSLAGVYAPLLSRASNDDQVDLVDRLCQFVLEGHADKERLRSRAANTWVINSSDHRQWQEVVGRLDILLDEGMPEVELLNSFSRTVYGVIQNAEPEVKHGMLAVGKRLGQGELNDAQSGRLKVLMFDSSFLMEDYEKVLVALKDGIPEKDEDWHEMAINKVAAHKALKEGNIDEAVERFRAFMDVTDRTWEEAQVDPSTGIRHSREMILGFNACRIGNIYADAGRTEDAQEAYSEAIAYYEAALKKAEPDSPEYKKIVADLNGIPAGALSSDK